MSNGPAQNKQPAQTQYEDKPHPNKDAPGPWIPGLTYSNRTSSWLDKKPSEYKGGLLKTCFRNDKTK